MVRKGEDELKQIRMTQSDTLRFQHKLDAFLRRKIEEPVMTQEEIFILPNIVSGALLSRGSLKEFLYRVPGGKGVVNLGSVHSTLLKMRLWAKDIRYVTLVDGANKYRVDLSDVWRCLYQECLDLFPRSLAEAVSMSKEVKRRHKPSSYEFSSEEEDLV